MHSEDVKFSRLVKVAKMYYEDDLSQNEIAKTFNISRPMVSKLLKEAKELSIVSISINDVKNAQEALGEKIASLFNLKQVIVISKNQLEENPDCVSKVIFDTAFTKTSVRQKVGISFGSSIGSLASYCDKSDIKKLKLNGDILPIIGGLHASFTSYNTNKLVKSLAKKTNLKANILDIPALLNSNDEKISYKNTQHFKLINSQWDNLDTALINVSNLFTTPDLATSIRFENNLIRQKAVGRLLAYPFDINGSFISPKRDIVMQIEIEQLRKSREVIAVFTQKLDTMAAIGALNTKLFTKCILTEELAHKIIKYYD